MGDRYKVLSAEKNGVELIDVTECDLVAENVFYNNATSGLTSVDVQAAITELALSNELNFSYKLIDSLESITIKLNQQMNTFGKLTINGTLVINGEAYIGSY